MEALEALEFVFSMRLGVFLKILVDFEKSPMNLILETGRRQSDGDGAALLIEARLDFPATLSSFDVGKNGVRSRTTVAMTQRRRLSKRRQTFLPLLPAPVVFTEGGGGRVRTATLSCRAHPANEFPQSFAPVPK